MLPAFVGGPCDGCSPPSLRVAVEIDSAVWSSDSGSYRRDRVKWNPFTQLGWSLLIVTELDLREGPARVAADLRAWLARGAAGRGAVRTQHELVDAKTARGADLASKTSQGTV